MYAIGQKVPAKELTELLDAAPPVSHSNDAYHAEMLKHNLGAGWQIDHASYKPALRLTFRGSPGFVIYLRDPDMPNVLEPMEVPYGPQVRDVILSKVDAVYWIRNVERAIADGWTPEQAREIDPRRSLE